MGDSAESSQPQTARRTNVGKLAVLKDLEVKLLAEGGELVNEVLVPVVNDVAVGLAARSASESAFAKVAKTFSEHTRQGAYLDADDKLSDGLYDVEQFLLGRHVDRDRQVGLLADDRLEQGARGRVRVQRQPGLVREVPSRGRGD